MRIASLRPSIVLLAVLGFSGPALAQPLGTFRWQLQPYCNVVSLAVTQVGGVYRLEGTDDQCGTGAAASALGTGFVNPGGSIGFGLSIVTAPGGAPVHVDATITLPGLSGTWRDNAGRTGAFTFTPGAPAPGSPRPPQATAAGITQILAGTGLAGGGTSGTVRLDLNTTPTGAFDFFNLNGFVSNVSLTTLAGSLAASGPGKRLLWSPPRAAFRVGGVNGTQWDDASVGLFSVAMGYNTVASGSSSFALGSTATASGMHAMSLGTLTTANGEGSMTFGHRAVTTPAASGSIVFADRSSVNNFTSFAPNEFQVRAAGGVGFYTNAATTSGVYLAAGGSQWLLVSDVNTKHRFTDVDGEGVLRKLAAMPIQEWSYKAQDASIRHVGPTAQDFQAAFGLGEDPLRIGTMDADGIAFAAVKALEARTRELRDEHAELRRLLRELRLELDSLRGQPR